GLCWKSGVAAEVIGIPNGSIGEKLYMSKIYLETADLFAWTLVIILVSRLCEGIFTSLVKLMVKRVERM
ncbi:MAG: nitrate ABC transporter permease, partial [Ruminiclostridium sp.]|nr:nitrate ABC transporter permease [Ruminiclostridium sp.]